jgi:tryptophan 7-halogenase
MIKNVLVLGAGSAGLLAALTLRRKAPQFQVRVLRSREIGVIGVGEGTTPVFPNHILLTLGIPAGEFYARAEPLWKLGVKFLWGPRGRFDFTFSQQLDAQWSDLPRPNGFYCDAEFQSVDLAAALMHADKVFPRNPKGGGPAIQPWYGFHIENRKLVDVLEQIAVEWGVEIIDGTMSSAERGPNGIAAIHLEDGQRLAADLFVDASGFRSELLGKALEEPFISFDRSLFCDRAVVGGWERTTEPILPYTTAETMDAGWSWQIEHEHHVNRGYVFASQSISDEQAAEEFRRKNPKVPKDLRIVKFRSGYHRRSWVDNVLAIGNANGFVEPLEATALLVICQQLSHFLNLMEHCRYIPTPTMQELYNDLLAGTWNEIRDFLSLHYKFNTLLDTPFWRHCREDTDVGGAGPLLAFYAENGPTGLCRYKLPQLSTAFGIEGYLVMLVGNGVPYRARHRPSVQELGTWKRHIADCAAQARGAMDVREALDCIRHPAWRWNTAPQSQTANATP